MSWYLARFWIPQSVLTIVCTATLPLVSSASSKFKVGYCRSFVLICCGAYSIKVNTFIPCKTRTIRSQNLSAQATHTHGQLCVCVACALWVNFLLHTHNCKSTFREMAWYNNSRTCGVEVDVTDKLKQSAPLGGTDVLRLTICTA